MSRTRDMSAKQFAEACERRGFKPAGFMGYYDIGNGRHVSVLNAGHNRRNQLAYLIQNKRLADDEAAAEAKAEAARQTARQAMNQPGPV